MSVLTQKQMDDIVFYRARKQSTKRIAALVKVSESLVDQFIAGLPKKEKLQPQVVRDPTPEEIEAACAQLRAIQKRYPRYDSPRESELKRMPRHYANMPKELRG